MTAPLRTLVGWAVIGNLGLAAAQWGVVSVIAKGGGTADVGTFTLALALTAPLLAVSQVQLRAVLVTDALHTTPFAAYRNLRLATTALFLLLAPVVAAWGGRGGGVVAVVSVFAVAKAFDSVADIYLGYEQRAQRLRFIAVAQLLNGTMSLAFSWLALVTTGDLLATMVAYAVGSAGSLVFWTLPGARRSLRSDPAERERGAGTRESSRLLAVAAPLGLVMLLAALSANVPRYVVEEVAGREALGVFGAVSYVILVGSNVIAAVGAAFSPRLARFAADRDWARFRGATGRLFLLCVAVGAGGAVASALVGGWVLRLVYTPDIASHQRLLVLLSLASCLSFLAIGTSVAVTAARRFIAQVPVLAAAVLLGGYASWLGLRVWGLDGVALGVAVGGLAQATGGVAILALTQRSDGKVTP